MYLVFKLNFHHLSSTYSMTFILLCIYTLVRRISSLGEPSSIQGYIALIVINLVFVI